MTCIPPSTYRSSGLIVKSITRLAFHFRSRLSACGGLRDAGQCTARTASAQESEWHKRCNQVCSKGGLVGWRVDSGASGAAWVCDLLNGSLVLILIVLGLLVPASAQTAVFNCSSFASTGSCGVGSGQSFAPNGVLSVSSPNITFIPTGQVHRVASLWWNAPVNIQQFSSTFTFVPNGQNFAFVVQNDVGTSGNGTAFDAGAGCESGFYQAFGAGPLPNNLLALELDSYSPLTLTGAFTYSSAQIYQANQSPCLPNDDGPGYTPTVKLSTYPVDLTTGSQDTTTGDTYSVTVSYDGSTLTVNMYDVTKGGSCPGAACFTQAWSTNIPSLVGSNTAYVGFTAATGLVSLFPLYLDSFSYTEGPTTQATGPVFAPGGGTYPGAQSVALSSASSGAVICYNTTGSPATDGSTSCSAGLLYTGPITVSSSETLYAVAGGTGYNDSSVGSATYVIQAAVATPTLSPGGGTYSTAQAVTISDATAGATIYYTTDGTAPTTSSIKYASPIAVSSTEKLEAIAVATGDINSSVVSAAYTITPLPTVAMPTFSPSAGTYSSAQSVSLADSTSGAAIYYTTDGSTPTTFSNAYTGPITVSSTEKLQAIAIAPGDTNSAIASALFTIDIAVPATATPTFSLPGGTYSSAQSVTIFDATSDAVIYYTTNGTTPTTASAEYAGPITVSSTESLEAIAVAPGDTNSAVAFTSFTINLPLPLAPMPTFSPTAGAYTAAQSVTILDDSSSAVIYYTTDGTMPTTSSSRYSGAITVGSTETLEAVAIVAGDNNSAVASAVYTITTSLPLIAPPTFSPGPGNYNSAQTVTVVDAAPDAAVYYTTDGTTPTPSSTKYSGPIVVSSTETLEAIAVSTSESAVASAAYTLTLPQPNFMVGTSPSSIAIVPGRQGTVTLTVTPLNGFAAPVILACAGLPAGATCSFEEATVTPAGSAASTLLTISTSAPSSALRPGGRPFLPWAALAMTVCGFGWRKRRRSLPWLLPIVGCVSLGLLSGCGVSGATGASPGPVSSMVTVTAISGSLQGTTVIALTVE